VTDSVSDLLLIDECLKGIRRLALRTYENSQSVSGTRFECGTSRISKIIAY